MVMTDVAWAAGLFDGEGCVSYTNPKDRPNPRIYLALSMIDKKTVEKFYSIVGIGHITILKHYEEMGYLRQYRWHTERGIDVARVIKLLSPYLITKRPQINKALKNWHKKFNADKSRNWKYLLAKTKDVMPHAI